MMIKSMSDFGDYYVACMAMNDGSPIMDPYMKIDKKTGIMSGFNNNMVKNFFDKYEKGILPADKVRVLNSMLKRKKCI